MYCKDIMIERKEVISVTSDYTLAKAIDRMDLYGYRTLPVVNYGRYLGVIDKNSIYEHIYIKSDVDLDAAVVSDVMRTDITKVYGNDFIESAATAFFSQRYQFVPVLMDGTDDQFLGIIPINTMMDIFAASLGLGQPAHRIVIEIDDYKGEIAAITKSLLRADANIISFVTVQHRVERTVKGSPKLLIVIKFQGDLQAVLNACRDQGARVTHVDLYEGEFGPSSRSLPAYLLGLEDPKGE